MSKLPEPVELSSESDERRAVWGYTEYQMLQFRREALEEAAQLVKAIESDRHDWEDWPTDSREAFRKLKEET
jgi:hypothetical protein